MTNTYFPLHVHSMWSLLDGLSTPTHLIDRLKAIDLPGTAVTDHGSISGSITMLKAFKDTDKKLIIGCEFYVCEHDATIKNENNRKLTHLVLLAKNDEGWKNLIKIVSEANKPEHFYYKPRLSLNQLSVLLKDIIGFSGHWGSTLAEKILNGDGTISETALQDGTAHALYLKEIFGDDFYLECQLVDQASKPIVEVVRQISKATNIPCIATPDAHYAFPEPAVDQQVLVATNLNKTLYECTDPNFGMGGFFRCLNYYIPSYDDMISFGNTEEELANTLVVASKCEPYTKILHNPIAPPFTCPVDYTANKFLDELCNKGFDIKIKEDKDGIYKARLEEELGVLQGANLATYFLIMWDILNYVRDKGWLQGVGRGSSAGCFVSYLLGITSIDPIIYDLLFSRFYNAGRNTAERISMPDIDIDIPAGKRDEIIAYIKEKYGHDKVSQMITLQTMKGRGALKAVLRAHKAVTATEMNQITKFFPEEAKIADELQLMKEEDGESSIIRWTLENDKKGYLKPWCYINEKDELCGPLAKYFEQAIRLEGTKTAQSKHAAGIVISSEPLTSMCPIVYDSKNETIIAGLEMNDIESIGLIKYDILGLNLLDKLMGISEILEFGDIKDE